VCALLGAIALCIVISGQAERYPPIGFMGIKFYAPPNSMQFSVRENIPIFGVTKSDDLSISSERVSRILDTDVKGGVTHLLGWRNNCWDGASTKFWYSIREIYYIQAAGGKIVNFVNAPKIKSICLPRVRPCRRDRPANDSCGAFSDPIVAVNSLDQPLQLQFWRQLGFFDNIINLHLLQLTAHDIGLSIKRAYRSISLLEGGEGIPMLLVGALPHFGQHTNVNESQYQRPDCEQNGGVGSAPLMVATAPPSAWPSEITPDEPSKLAKALVIGGVVLLCAVLIWFGTPALFIGIDQGSPLLLIGGILAVAAMSAAILYAINFCLF
jgi:hypothetical protein